MASKARALKALKDGGKLVNGLICLWNGGLDTEANGRLTPAQLKSIEQVKGVVAWHESGTTIHIYQKSKRA